MKSEVYLEEARTLLKHWWFIGRRKHFASTLAKHKVDKEALILDMGISSGTNLLMLHQNGYKNVVGIDLSTIALTLCRTAGHARLIQGNCETLPFANSCVDVVLATDILEHLDDEKALTSAWPVLKQDGFMLVTVPAFQSLWGLQDEVSWHKRRYRKHEIIALAERSGYNVETIYYFNFILFIPIWIVRQLLKILPKKPNSENQINSPTINWLLTRIFKLDLALAPKISPPFGVSILAILRKRRDHRADLS